ncbi:interleukin-34 isoform X2 [Acipenser ruthenus]|uniref:interleukin-34 isoform X2 n=2 Tax=Acipenser ruthenus TaxID=7906 RepID=UPI0027414252|nr:interleukin-34 isoform X2 [Acipenser ruthenus]
MLQLGHFIRSCISLCSAGGLGDDCSSGVPWTGFPGGTMQPTSKPWAFFTLITGVLSVLPPLAMSSTDMCRCLYPLERELRYNNRLQFTKHNFPINYTILVHHEEVLRISNITRLSASLKSRGEEDIEGSLQRIWLYINKEVMKKIRMVLPEQHPSQRYISDLEGLLKLIQMHFPQSEEWEFPELLQEIYGALMNQEPALWKKVKPKALLDNCCKTMKLLFECDWNGRRLTSAH